MIERLAIVPSDGVVSINGTVFSGIDMSAVPQEIHAVQWYGQHGEIEYRTDSTGTRPPNRPIDSLEAFSALIDIWDKRRQEGKMLLQPPSSEIRATLFQQVQEWMDQRAREKGYDSLLAACSYALSGNPLYAAEAGACISWRDAVWEAVFAFLDNIPADADISLLTEELMALLPEISWPHG